MRPGTKRALSALGLAALAAVLFGRTPRVLSHEGHEAEAARGVIRIGDALFLEPRSRAAAGLEFGEVDLGPVEETLDVPARLTLAPEHTGFATSGVGGRITKLLVRPGDRVRKGDVVAEIESLDLVAMQADLIRARIALDAEAKNLERLERLKELRTASARELILAKTAEKEARAALEGARGRLLILGIDRAVADAIADTAKPLDALPIVAPIDGVVLRVDVEGGQIVAATEHLVHVADLRRLRVEAAVPEVHAARIAEGLRARVRFAGATQGAALTTIARVAPTIEGGALRVFVEVEDEKGLLRAEGGAVLSIVLSGESDAVLAPRAGIFRRGGESFAIADEPLNDDDREALRERLADAVNPLPDWARALASSLLDSPGARKIQRKPVRLGRRTGDVVEIEGDVLPGDKIVTSGGHLLASLFAPGVLHLDEAAREALGLETAEAMPRTLDVVARGAATVGLPPGRRAVISPPLDGILASVRVRAGDAVKAGDVLAEVESLEAKELSLALLVATLRLEAARAQRDNLASLASAGIPSGRETLEAESAVRRSEAERDGLRRQLKALSFDDAAIDANIADGRLLVSYPLRSPIDGRVAAARGAIGGAVTKEDAIAVVVDASVVWIEGALAETDGRLVPPGALARARFVARDREIVTGRVAVVGREVRLADRALPIWLEIENPDGRLLPGMTGTIAVVTTPLDGDGDGREVIAVPRDAVLNDGGRPFVLVESGESYLRVDTETGRSDDIFVELRRGVYPGDRVLVRGAESVRTALAGVR